MSIKLHQLKAFAAVAEQGSIRGASRILSLSQPAVTKAIKELEENLGISLVQRGSRGILLTECGTTLFQRTQLILRELELAREDVRQYRDRQTRGSVRIGVAVSIAAALIPGVIAQFMKEFPDAEIQVSDGQVQHHLQRLRQGEIDFCINTAPPNAKDGDLSFEKLIEMRFALIVRRDHPMAKARTLDELSHCQWIMPPSRPGFHDQFFELLAERGLSPRRLAVTCDSFFAAVSMAANTDFIAPISETSLENFLSEGKVVRIPLDSATLPLATFYLIQRASSPLTPLAARLAQIFRIHARPKYGASNGKETGKS